MEWLSQFSEKKPNGKWVHYVTIKCDCCGEIRKAEYTNAKRYKTSLCRKCYVKNKMQTHGFSTTRLYKIWQGMKNRCSNPNAGPYPDYGGRGITVYQEWQESFMSFREWAIANGYTDDLEIDRIDNNGNYEPDNCRWITHSENMKNRIR